MSYIDAFSGAFYDRLKEWSDFTENDLQQLTALASAQSQHESADYTSNVFEHANNAIGYKYYSGSPWQIGSYNGYAKYMDITGSANELADWIHRRAGSFKGVETVTDYANIMKSKGYYEDSSSNYINGMSNYYQSPSGDYSTEDPPLLETVASSVKLNAVVWAVMAVLIAVGIWFVRFVLKRVPLLSY